MENKSVLISGAGIAGTCLAFWLRKFGFNPTIVEIAPRLREGGYAIDFMGAGYEVAERMGIIGALDKVDLNISKVSFVDGEGREKGSMNYRKIKRLMNNRALTLLRSDLAHVIYDQLDAGTERIFGDSIVAIEDSGKAVTVTFRSGSTRQFDLVVGADGLHSNVRKLVFGEEKNFENYYGYYTSSYTIRNYEYSGNAFSMYNTPGRQVAIYSEGGGTTVTFFIFTSPEKIAYDHHDVAAQKKILVDAFRDAGWRCPELLARIDDTDDFYFDPVSQIKMESWSKGRVTLVGDAGDCPSLLSGKGSTLAMVGAYILAGELKNANGDHTRAFEQYQRIFKPFIERKQRSAQSFAKSFVPKSKFGIWVRNIAFRLISISFFSRLVLGQFEDRELKMKVY